MKYLNAQLGVFFKCEIEKLMSAKIIKRGFLSKNVFVYYNILSFTYVTLSFWKFSKFSFKQACLYKLQISLNLHDLLLPPDIKGSK